MKVIIPLNEKKITIKIRVEIIVFSTLIKLNIESIKDDISTIDDVLSAASEEVDVISLNIGMSIKIPILSDKLATVARAKTM